MELRKLKGRTKPSYDRDFGNIEVGRGASKSQPSPSEMAYCAHLEQLKTVKLAGYRFLKPPGVSKTLKNLQEEEIYNQEFSSSALSGAPSRGTLTSQGDVSHHEQIAESSESDENNDDNFDYTPDLSMPTMNASWPSIYLPPP